MSDSYSIKVDTKPFEDDFKLYLRKDFTFVPGINSLVGCNGSGKTTLINYIKRNLRKSKINCIDYNDRHSGGQNMMSAMCEFGDMQGLANMFVASEGERIVQGLNPIFGSLKKFFSENKNKDAFILLDAIDSGMSVDEIIEVRDVFLDLIIPDAKSSYSIDLYLVIAANNYEWCNDSRIHNINISTGKTLDIDSYETYKNIILKSRKTKDKLRGVEPEE